VLIDSKVFAPVIDIVQTAPFRTRRQAAYVLTNAALVGNCDQVRHLVSLGCIVALCQLLNVGDCALISAVLSALASILLRGSVDPNHITGENPFADSIEECGGTVFAVLKWLRFQMQLYGIQYLPAIRMPCIFSCN
jgi:importin subunit alpha-6/7